MKLSYRQIESFVRAPDPKARAILIYGPDSGLVRERAGIIGKSVVADLNDPFNAVTLAENMLIEDSARLFDEANAMSMMGGNRLIRVEDASDKLAPLFKEYLAAPSSHNLVVVEAGGLGPRSPLRALFEKSDAAAALPCYVDEGRDLEGLIRDGLQQAGYGIERDALSWLAANAAGNRQRVRSEIEKLVLYMGPAEGWQGPDGPPVNGRLGMVTLEDTIASCGEAGALGLDDLVYAVGGARPDVALQTFARLIGEGVPVIVVLRTLQNHFRRLHLTKARMEAGTAAEQALKQLTPPIFFKQQDAFRGQLQRWSLSALSRVLERLAQIEAQCKKTGTPDETLCAQAILGISKSA